MLSLTLETGPDAGRVFAQEDASAPDGLLFRLGRDEGAHIVLQDPRISTQHVEVHIGDGGYLLRDLGSTNGTRLERGNETFEVRGETALRHSDVILVGAFVAPTRLRVTIREEEANPQVVSVSDLAELNRADLGLAGDFSIRTLNALTLE